MHAERKPNLSLSFMMTWKSERNRKKTVLAICATYTFGGEGGSTLSPLLQCNVIVSSCDPLCAENAAEITWVSSGNSGDNRVSRAKKRGGEGGCLRKALQKKIAFCSGFNLTGAKGHFLFPQDKLRLYVRSPQGSSLDWHISLQRGSEGRPYRAFVKLHE